MDIKTIKNVLIAYDFSSCADRALAMGVTIARQFKAEALIVNIINQRDIEAIEHAANRAILAKISETLDDMVRNFREDRLLRLNDALSKYQYKGSRLRSLISVGDPVEEILQLGKKYSVDLIVMGARGHSRITRLLTGSKAESLFRLSSIPILSVRDGKDI